MTGGLKGPDYMSGGGGVGAADPPLLVVGVVSSDELGKLNIRSIF